jgi:hypothetical protein
MLTEQEAKILALTMFNVIEDFTPEERTSVLSELHSVVCVGCGRGLEDGERCHCRNDE